MIARGAVGVRGKAWNEMIDFRNFLLGLGSRSNLTTVQNFWIFLKIKERPNLFSGWLLVLRARTLGLLFHLIASHCLLFFRWGDATKVCVGSRRLVNGHVTIYQRGILVSIVVVGGPCISIYPLVKRCLSFLFNGMGLELFLFFNALLSF